MLAYERMHKKFPQLGRNSYISPGSMIFDKNTKIGNFCSISWNVCVGVSSHPLNFLSTSPFQYAIQPSLINLNAKMVDFCGVKPCKVGNDVWIGCYTVILDGVEIGDGAVIGANSTITKNVPPYAIVVGANRIIGYRFDEKTIEELLKLKWWDLDDEYILDLPFDNISKCIERLKEIRLKIPVRSA